MNIDVLVASNLWWKERKEKGAHHWITKIIPFLYDALEALYLETRKLPLKTGGSKIDRKVDTSYTFNCNLFPNSEDYRTLRLILSLCGDVYNLLETLKPFITNGSLFELSTLIANLHTSANKFMPARNFFTHIGYIITDMDRHGISGPKKSNCGIRYTESARSCVYLVWENNTIYFTRYRKQYKVTIDRPASNSIFKTAIEIYKVLIGNEANRIKMQCISPGELYPDYNT